jgi:pimeloyl-ACP methyl ester carboxylesterase
MVMSKIRVRGIEMAYDEAGSGTAVVLLHGYPFNRSMWSEQIEVLMPSFHVVAPDLRGFGESTASPDLATMDDMARDVAELTQALGVSRAAICGLSMGGYVALALCRMFALRVRALILADTRAQADTDETRANRARQAEEALRDGMVGIAEAMLPKLLSPATLANRPEIVARLREMMINTKSEGTVAALRGMAQRRDQTPFLHSIISPTLILVGSDDKITPLEDAEMMHREIGGSRLEIIEGAGHVSNMEQPESFNRALLQFLREQEI